MMNNNLGYKHCFPSDISFHMTSSSTESSSPNMAATRLSYITAASKRMPKSSSGVLKMAQVREISTQVWLSSPWIQVKTTEVFYGFIFFTFCFIFLAEGPSNKLHNIQEKKKCYFKRIKRCLVHSFSQKKKQKLLNIRTCKQAIFMLEKEAIHTTINLPARTAYNKCWSIWLQIYAWTNLSCKQSLVLATASNQGISCKKQAYKQKKC